MSKYSTNNVPMFKDSELLIAALCDMGFERQEIEVHEQPSQLIDFQGHATCYTDKNGDKAHIILRASAVNRHLSGGASNDIGFRRNGDGSFNALISAYDSNFADSAWIGRLSAAYTRHGVIKKAAKQGFRFIGTKQENGKTQLKFVRAGR